MLFNAMTKSPVMPKPKMSMLNFCDWNNSISLFFIITSLKAFMASPNFCTKASPKKPSMTLISFLFICRNLAIDQFTRSSRRGKIFAILLKKNEIGDPALSEP